MADEKVTKIVSPYRLKLQASRSVDNVHELLDNKRNTSAAVAIDENTATMACQDVETIKSNLFELFQRADMDSNEQISIDEFSSAIRTFVPNTTNTKIHNVLSAFDLMDDDAVFYVQFLSDANFNKFLQYNGYVTDDHGVISVQQHDKQIIEAQEEIITNLNTWITDIGKPCETQCKDLQIVQTQNESLHQELSVISLQFETLKQELIKTDEDKQSVQHELETATNDKDMLSHKLTHIKQQLQQSKEALEHYHKSESKWKQIEDENTDLQQENIRLTNRIEDELCIINEFERTTSKLHQASATNLDKIDTLTQGRGEYEDMITDLKDEIETANHIISRRNAQIAQLNEKLRFKKDDDPSSSDESHPAMVFQSSLQVHNARFQPSPSSIRSAGPAPMPLDFDRSSNWDNTAVTAQYHRFHDDPSQDPSDIFVDEHEEHGTQLSWEMKMMEYEVKETQWNKVKEDMKMETDRLRKELDVMKEQMEEQRKLHDEEIERLIESHLQNEFQVRGVGDRSASIESDLLSADDENAPFLQADDVNRAGNATYNPVCCGWKLW
eukprot:223859_1